MTDNKQPVIESGKPFHKVYSLGFLVLSRFTPSLVCLIHKPRECRVGCDNPRKFEVLRMIFDDIVARWRNEAGSRRGGVLPEALIPWFGRVESDAVLT
jgi:hypothetical protein